jgi:signal transduction histidine kinase
MGKANILMVDDQPGKLLSYEAMLSELRQNLLTAHNANEALDCLLKNDVAVVLMDVSMPEIDGFQLADMILAHPRFGNTAIIFISAVHMTDADRLNGYRHGAVDYLSVPIIPELLRAKVRVFVDLHRKARELSAVYAEIQSLSRRMLSLQDEERRRIARELHDSLGQELTAAKMMADRIRSPEAKSQAAEVGKLIEKALNQVRTISHLLHPPLLEEAGLVAALRWYVEGLAKRSGIETILEVQPSEFPRCDAEQETAIYRIVQEALTNVFRHSGAHKASIRIAYRDSQIAIAVRDDGRGIPPDVSKFKPGSLGVGIGGMRQRVAELGGVIRLENTNPGTLLGISFPVKLADSDGRLPSGTRSIKA